MPYKITKGHIRQLMAIQDHANLQKATHGREMRQENIKQCFFHFKLFSLAIIFARSVREHFVLPMSHFLSLLSRILFDKKFLLLLFCFLFANVFLLLL